MSVNERGEGQIIDATYTIWTMRGKIMADGEVAFHPEDIDEFGMPYIALPDISGLPMGQYMVELRIEVDHDQLPRP